MPVRPSIRPVALAPASVVAVLCAVTWAGALPAAAVGGDPAPEPRYAAPVDRPVADPFRLPDGPYGAGNRGIEYLTVGGETVRAVGPGVVAFVGTVAGRLVLSVVHPDGLRSMLTGLAAVDVSVGDRVETGSPVGRAGPRLHLGVRRGRTYLDPASLLGRPAAPRHAVLVPLPARGARWGSAPPDR